MSDKDAAKVVLRSTTLHTQITFHMIDLSALGIPKTILELAVMGYNGENAKAGAKLSGAVQGERAAEAASILLKGKISDDAIKAIAAAAGKLVGDSIEAIVNYSEENANGAGNNQAPLFAKGRSTWPPWQFWVVR